MSRTCDLLGTSVRSGNAVSHSKRRTKRTWRPNLQKKTIHLPELGSSVSLTLSSTARRTIEKKGGLAAVLRSMPETVLSAPMRRLKKQLASK